jgi:hypothetical protein
MPADQAPPPPADQAPNAQAPADNAGPGMDPETATEVVATVFAMSVDAGMSPDFVAFAIEVDPEGNVVVAGKGADGTAYQGKLAAADIANAMGMEESQETPAQEQSEQAPPPPAK